MGPSQSQQDENETQAFQQLTSYLHSLTDYVSLKSHTLASVLASLKQFLLKDTSILTPDRTTPLTETTIIMAHNAYNVSGTEIASTDPNQTLKKATKLTKAISNGIPQKQEHQIKPPHFKFQKK